MHELASFQASFGSLQMSSHDALKALHHAVANGDEKVVIKLLAQDLLGSIQPMQKLP